MVDKVLHITFTDTLSGTITGTTGGVRAQGHGEAIASPHIVTKRT
jgi:hypothetical protein